MCIIRKVPAGNLSFTVSVQGRVDPFETSTYVFADKYIKYY